MATTFGQDQRQESFVMEKRIRFPSCGDDQQYKLQTVGDENNLGVISSEQINDISHSFLPPISVGFLYGLR